MSEIVYVIEITAAIDDAGTTATLLLTDGEGWTTRPGDTPANTHVMPRVTQVANFRRDLFTRGAIGGVVESAYGEAVFANADGALDAWANYGFDGRKFIVRVGPAKSAYPSGFATVLTATMSTALFDWAKIKIRLRDRLELLKKPLCRNSFAGTGGLEGPSALAGTRRPKGFGYLYNISPVLVDGSALIYQVNDGAINMSTNGRVRDKGALLTNAGPVADQAGLLAASPAAGTFVFWPAGGYIKLGSAPEGEVTVDAYATTPEGNYGAGAMLKNLAVCAGISASDINSSDVSGLTSSALAVWEKDESKTVLDQMAAVANSACVWYGFDRSDQLRMGPIAIGTPVATLTIHDLVSISRKPLNDDTAGIPVWRVTSSHTRNRTVQTSFAVGVSAANQAAYGRQYSKAEASNAAVKVKHLDAKELATETLFSDPSGSGNNASAVLAQYAPGREILEVVAKLTQELITAVDIGKALSITLPRYSYASGKSFLIIGIRTDYRRGVAELTLWG